VTARRGRDGRTRRRVTEAATRLFAARGFQHVTVRAICHDAHANVAAVNYHFGDKMGLYREVIEEAAAIVVQVSEEAIQAGAGLPAEGRLRAYIRVHCERIFQHGPAPLLQQLMHRELQDPTRMLTSIIDRVWRPRFEYLATIVAELLSLPIDDDRVIRCVLSIHAQVVTIRPSPALDRMGAKVKEVFTAASVTEHIARFSLAGLAAYR
jgi:TetR/AcrR family transcriptional regulator, regulator of cefoperazone and chloramphenicol sensitivity